MAKKQNNRINLGDGVSPKTALAVGLKVDVDALPKDLVKNLKAGKERCRSIPQVTLARSLSIHSYTLPYR